MGGRERGKLINIDLKAKHTHIKLRTNAWRAATRQTFQR